MPNEDLAQLRRLLDGVDHSDTAAAVAIAEQLLGEAHRLRAEVERLRQLVRGVDAYGTGYEWRRDGHKPVLIDPKEIAVYIGADQSTEVERLRAELAKAGDRIEQLETILTLAETWRADYDDLSLLNPAEWALATAIDDLAAAGQGGAGDEHSRCDQCGQPIEWREDIDWWVHVDAGHDTHMPPNARFGEDAAEDPDAWHRPEMALYHDHLNGRHNGPENYRTECVGCDRDQLAHEWQQYVGLHAALSRAIHIEDGRGGDPIWVYGFRACAVRVRQVLDSDNPVQTLGRILHPQGDVAPGPGTVAEGGGEGLSFAVAGYGSYLATREIGRRIRESLIEQISSRPFVSSLIVDFNRVEAMTIAFTDELLGRLFADWPLKLAPDAVLIIGLNEDTMSAVVTALTRRDIDCVRGADLKLRIVAPWAAIERQAAASRAGQAGEEEVA